MRRQPGEGALNDPTPLLQDKTALLFVFGDDFESQAAFLLAPFNDTRFVAGIHPHAAQFLGNATPPAYFAADQSGALRL